MIRIVDNEVRYYTLDEEHFSTPEKDQDPLLINFPKKIVYKRLKARKDRRLVHTKNFMKFICDGLWVIRHDFDYTVVPRDLVLPLATEYIVGHLKHRKIRATETLKFAKELKPKTTKRVKYTGCAMSDIFLCDQFVTQAYPESAGKEKAAKTAELFRNWTAAKAAPLHETTFNE